MRESWCFLFLHLLLTLLIVVKVTLDSECEKYNFCKESIIRLGHVDVEGVFNFYRDFSTRVNGKLVREPSRIIDKFIVRLLSPDRHNNVVIIRDQVYNRLNYTHCLTVTLARAYVSLLEKKTSPGHASSFFPPMVPVVQRSCVLVDVGCPG